MPTTINGTIIQDQADSSLQGVTSPTATNDVVLVRLGSVSSAFSGSAAGAESVAFEDGKTYSTNLNANTIVISQITNNTDGPATIATVGSIALSGLTNYKTGGVNSVAVKNGVIAVAYENSTQTSGGYIALFNASDNTLIKTIQVGVLPDMVTFTPDGSKILVANEAERLSSTSNPAGSISIIDLSTGAANASVSNTISFDHLNGSETTLRAQGLNILSGQLAGQDIEPEYITISPDGTRAYVTLQEVNGVAVIDLTDPSASKPIAIQPLGYVDWSLAGNKLDTSDQDGTGGTASLLLRNFPNLRGLLQPDAIASFTVGGSTYFVTANEGDARVPDSLTDSLRLSSSSYVLDPTAFPNASTLKQNANLGRLNVLSGIGDTDGDGDYDVIYALGGRGISIFKQNADGTITKVRETGGEFEAITAALSNGSPAFNSNQSVAGSSFDTRSDDKGPEPEGVTIGVVNGRTYAFVGLERVGGLMVYDVTDPANASFVGYQKEASSDLGPEVQAFISASNSPTGQALLVSGNEISNTVTLYSVQTQSEGADTITGSDGADTFNGRGGNDTIKGFGGNDTLTGGAGNDTLEGGADTDTAVYTGARSGYTVTTVTNAAGLVTGFSGVTDTDTGNGDEGTDTLTGVEKIAFANQTLDLGQPVQLFGADGALLGTFATIQAAVDAAVDGQTIRIAAGTYTENVNFNKAVTVLGAQAGVAGTDAARGVATGTGETTLIGRQDITESDGAVVLNGLRFLNTTATTGGGASDPTLQIATGTGHQVTNSVFYSAVVGGANGVDDRAISVPVIGSGQVSITNNYITGASAGAFSTASWGRGIWFDGGGVDLSVSGNRFEYTRTAINLDMTGDSEATISSNSFVTAGTGVSLGIDQVGTVFTGNSFTATGTEFNFRNLASAITFDASTAVTAFSGDYVHILGGNGADTLSGTDFADTIDGNNLTVTGIENDTLNGRGGNDVLFGRGGNDTIDGGTGTDTAFFSGAQSDYTVTRIGTSATVVDNRSGSPDGTDSLANVENLLFGAVTVALSSYNAGPAISSNGGGATASISVAENIAAVTTVVATDPNEDAVTYTITGGADQDKFAINASTGALTFKNAPNFEIKADAGGNNVYDVVVTASDGSLTDTQAIAVTVTDVADTGSSQTPYLLPVASNVTVQAIITTGDATSKVGGGTYLFGGIPDGLGMFDNGDGTVTVLTNHEIGFSGNTPLGVPRAHGAAGAYVSQLVIDKATLSVISGKDAITTIKLYDDATDTFVTASNYAINRLCSADLADQSAYYWVDPATNIAYGTESRIFMTGEESGTEGKEFAVFVTGPEAGTAYEFADCGLFSWENNLASPFAQKKTITIGQDDGQNGQVYVYVGEKRADGTEFEKAGLEGGNLYGVKVTNLINAIAANSNETDGTAASGRFTLFNHGDVGELTGTALDAASEAAGVTSFQRPEDGSWDPTNPNVYWFVTTASVTGQSRLYKMTFDDITQPELGGTIEAVLDSNQLPVNDTVGPRMMDNMTVNDEGKIIIQEDVGNNAFIGRVLQYDPVTDKLTVLSKHDPARFVTGGANFITQDEESSGVIDVTSTFGDANTKAYLLDTQVHKSVGGELVEGGQLQLIKVALNAPVITSNAGGATASISVAENGTAVTTVTSTDDVMDTVTYALGGTDANFFNINASTGVITFKNAPNFEVKADAGSNNVYDVVVTASDGIKTDTQALAITVTNVAPVITSNGGGDTASLIIDESEDFSNTVVASEPGVTSTVIYSIAGGADAARFHIDQTTGELTFITAPNVLTPSDAGADNIYDVVVKASDSNNVDALSDTQALSIEVRRFIYGTELADTALNGTAAGDYIFGLAGNDVISGLAGNDVIDGGTGADRMTGGTGNDTYVVDTVLDRVIEVGGEGTDTVQTGVAKYTLAETLENLTFTNSAAHYGIGNAAINTMIGNAGADKLSALGGNDLLQGLGGNDQLYGGSGNDRLEGGEGADKMIGGEGDDVYIVDNASDTASEGSNKGNDTVYASASYKLGSYVETLILTGSDAINGTGGNQANTIQGNGAANVLSGAGGNDVLAGGLGNDTLIGGKGADTFLFDSLPGAGNVDLVSDFLRTQLDVIQLSKADFAGLGAVGALGSAAFFSSATATAANDATDRIVYNTTSGALYYDADGLGGQAAVQIATFGTTTHPSLLFSDFQIVA